MINFVLALAAGGVTVILLPFYMLLVLTALAAWRAKAKVLAPAPRQAPLRFVLLVPAHNEAELIAATVSSLHGLDYPRERYEVLVIADNCSDQTAALARQAGALVWERSHSTLRGKGHALEWAIERLMLERQSTDLDAVVIIDADIGADKDLLWAFAAGRRAGYDFAQALYLGLNPEISWRTQLMNYALALFNGTWLMAQEELGMSVALRGNGMCFSVAGLKRCPWSTFGLAEDLEFSWRLRLNGERAHFVRAARINAQLVSQGGAAAASQRQRWEHGRKALRRLYTGELLRHRQLGFWRKAYYLLDLYMLPLSKLATWQLLATLIGLYLGMCGLGAVQAAMFIGMAGYALTPFFVLGLPWRYLLALRFLPVYVLWKLWLYGQRAPRQWIRTGREGGASKEG